jgi:peptidoglycan glycosyltransferase
MNAKIRRLALALMACYLVLFVQLNVLQAGPRRAELTEDPRNTRQTVRDFNRPRGPIITADGVVVAQTVPAVNSRFDYQREYPTGALFSDITGYYTLTYGSTQVERTHNDVLAGRTAEQQLRWITSLFRNPDTTGSVRLTLRADLQQVARDALGEREGSVVLLDPRTGAVLAMWSYPTFDPNLIAVHDVELAGQVIDFYNSSASKPLLANAYQERYMPGSAFKIITTATGLEAGVINPFSYWEPEREYLPPQTTRPIGNYRRTLCGGDLAEVFRRSCNTPFARTAVELGPERMVAGTEAWGFEQPVPIDLPRPAASTFAPDIDFTQNLPVLALQGFGQGSVQMTPLHMAMVAATVANGGVMMRPYVVDSTLDHEGRVLERTRPEQWLRPINRDTADYLTALMVQVVRDGTARCCMQLEGGVQAAAKTGTAQLNATGEPERSHAWITAFAPAEAPRFAVAVMLKGTNAEISAGTGGTLAGPVAKQVLDAAIAAIPA